ncbi:MAG: hypothetical protein COA39_011040, partial [Sulfurimonas sp.]|nr:hypothetical protein [Sulfurimonas sp.]
MSNEELELLLLKRAEGISSQKSLAKKSIKLIGNYIDESTLVLFTKRDANIKT